MTTVTIEEAQAKLPELVDRATAGEEVVIVRDQRPLVRLQSAVDPSAKEPRRPGLGKSAIRFIADDFDAPLDDFKEYME